MSSELQGRISALQVELDKSAPNMRAVEQYGAIKEREKEQVRPQPPEGVGPSRAHAAAMSHRGCASQTFSSLVMRSPVILIASGPAGSGGTAV